VVMICHTRSLKFVIEFKTLLDFFDFLSFSLVWFSFVFCRLEQNIIPKSKFKFSTELRLNFYLDLLSINNDFLVAWSPSFYEYDVFDDSEQKIVAVIPEFS
jgi:hypothetical protein